MATRIQRRGVTFTPFISSLPREAEELRTRMSRLFQEPLARFFGEPFPTEVAPQPLGWYPSVEISESANEYIVAAELPGMKQEDVKVEFEDGVLSISGEKQEEKKEEDRRYHLWERSYGTFLRTFSLPTAVNQEKITADMTEGVLTIRLPKTAEAKTHARKIEIGAKK